jgi:hypothetical protein
MDPHRPLKPPTAIPRSVAGAPRGTTAKGGILSTFNQYKPPFYLIILLAAFSGVLAMQKYRCLMPLY